MDKETNSTAYDRYSRGQLSCPLCPPNKGENARSKRKHGTKKPKYKNKRK